MDQIPKGNKFDIIYWNYPFHWTNATTVENMNRIEQAVRDPGYKSLEKLLATAKEYLTSEGQILTSYSLQLSNTKLINEFT